MIFHILLQKYDYFEYKNTKHRKKSKISIKSFTFAVQIRTF